LSRRGNLRSRSTGRLLDTPLRTDLQLPLAEEMSE
jgi:hypothetical protein